MKKTIIWFLIFLSLIALFSRFGFQPLIHYFGYTLRAGLKITAQPEAVVYFNDTEVGKTPFQKDDLSPGDYEVKLKNDKGTWQSKIKLNKGTLSVINRELGGSEASSSGEILVLEKGQGVVVTSTPEGAEVEIDNKGYGKTPLTIRDIISGEHTFIISHEGYLKRNIQASLPKELLLHIDVDLALSEVYLQAIPTPTPTIPLVEVTVKETPVGFLRVRDQPSLQGTEISRVNPGTSLILLEELASWVKVKLEDGKEGYVSAGYIQKK